MEKQLPKFIVILIIVLALLGFADSTFLLAKRITGGPIPCGLGFTGCDTVSKSPYSVLFGIPLSAFGMLFYLVIGVLGILYLDMKNAITIKLIMLATGLGFVMSLGFMYIQKYLIKAFCVYCIASALISTILFALGITMFRKLKK